MISPASRREPAAAGAGRADSRAAPALSGWTIHWWLVALETPPTLDIRMP